LLIPYIVSLEPLSSSRFPRSLHDALPIFAQRTQTTIISLLHLSKEGHALGRRIKGITRTIIQIDCPDPEQPGRLKLWVGAVDLRSEEHTSELQSQSNLVCRLILEKQTVGM